MAMGPGPLGKPRNPVAVWLLGIVTLGVYHLWWTYKVNEEIQRHDPRIEVNPGISLLAQLLPFANLVSLYRTAVRVRSMEMGDGVGRPVSPGLSLVLLFVFGVGYYLLVQGHLNDHWASHRPRPAQGDDGALAGALGAYEARGGEGGAGG